jgi:Putative metallopeptidase
MQHKNHVLAMFLLATMSLSSPAVAQQANAQSGIKIVYETPTNSKFTPIYERLKQRKVLEELQAFMAPLRLPREITVRVAQCGNENVPYKPQGPATVCYELIEKIERIAASHTKDNDLAQRVIIGGFVQALFHETALAVFDVLDVPIWGRKFDAADRLAAMVMMQFGDDIAITVMNGTQVLFAWSDQQWTGNTFAAEASPDWQRYFNYACIAFAANQPQFAFLLTNKLLPIFRAQQCANEYAQIRKAFDLRIMPHVDADLLIKVRTTPWLQWAQ